MSRFDTIDLSRVPVPDAIQGLDYERIFSERVADLLNRFEQAGIPFDVEGLETDPAIILQQEDAYRELLQLAMINDAIRAVLLPSSWGTNLDAIGAMFGVARQIVDPGNPNASPPVPPTYEDDERYRRRIQLAPEAFATTGSKDAYAFHALSAHAGVADVSVLNHADGVGLIPGEVAVVVLPAAADKVDEIVDAVRGRLMRSDVKPLTDALEIRIAEAVETDIVATLWIKRGPDPSVVRQTAQQRLEAYLSRQRSIGTVLAVSGIFGALQLDDVERVTLAAPTADIYPEPDGVVSVGTITLTTQYIDA